MENVNRNFGTQLGTQDQSKQDTNKPLEQGRQKYQNPSQEKSSRAFAQDGNKQKMPKPEEEKSMKGSGDGNKKDPSQEYRRPEEERTIGADDKPKHYQPEEDTDLGRDKDEF